MHQQNWHAGFQSPRALMRLKTWGRITRCTDLESTTRRYVGKLAEMSAVQGEERKRPGLYLESWDARSNSPPPSAARNNSKFWSALWEWLLSATGVFSGFSAQISHQKSKLSPLDVFRITPTNPVLNNVVFCCQFVRLHA